MTDDATRERFALLTGRNNEPLSDDDIRRAINTFLGLDRKAPVRFAATERTRFRISTEGEAEIVFGPDIYQGQNIIDPNSSLSMPGAAAHELSHYYRWHNKTELSDPKLSHIDEALTSLEAVQRFHEELTDHDIRQLISDAVQRLQIFAQKK